MADAVIFFSWVLAVIVMFILFFKYGRSKKVKLPRIEPTQAIEKNDRLIIVRNVTSNDISAAIKNFATQYEEEISLSAIKLIQLTNDEFAIIFPYGISFVLFCYAVNYIDCVFETSRVFIRGWTTLAPREMKLSESRMLEMVMVYISESDIEGDNVYLTTSENLGYKFDFSWEKESYPLSVPEKDYTSPPDISAFKDIMLNLEA